MCGPCHRLHGDSSRHRQVNLMHVVTPLYSLSYHFYSLSLLFLSLQSTIPLLANHIVFLFNYLFRFFFFYFIYRMYISRLHNLAALRPTMFPPLLCNTYKQGWEGVHSGQLRIGNCPTDNSIKEEKNKKKNETNTSYDFNWRNY
jgi:hypothetical protein